MKKFFISLSLMIILLSTGCNNEYKENLRTVIDTKVRSEELYTTESYNNYMDELQNADNIIKNIFSSTKDIATAQNSLQSAIDGLKYATIGIYRINYDFTMLSNDNVGDSWQSSVYYNGKQISNGYIIVSELNSNEAITMQGFITERDKIPDISSIKIKLTLKNNAYAKSKIIVRENRGRYSGHKAVWNIECRISLVERK